MFNPQQLKTFLINLDTSEQRLLSAKSMLDNIGIPFERISGVDGRHRNLDSFPEYDAQATLRYLGRPMKSTEVGCYLSHLKAVRAFLRSDAEYGLVLEDDFLARPHAFTILHKILGSFSCYQKPPFDLINLGRKSKLVQSDVADYFYESTSTTLKHAFYFPVLASALLWSREGAQHFVDTAFTPKGPVDHCIRTLMCKRGRGYAVNPPIFSVTNVTSDINGHGQPDKKSLIGRRHWCEVSRQSQNLWNSLKNRCLMANITEHPVA